MGLLIDTPEKLKLLYHLYDAYLNIPLSQYDCYSATQYRPANDFATEQIANYIRDANIIIDHSALKKKCGIVYYDDRGFVNEAADEDFIDSVDNLIYYDFPWTERSDN